MSNSYFKFKQFTIEQGDCAMKVSTDACIQGAWTPINEHVSSVLDIGTGTGLLSLMMAQRNATARIDAVELDASAAAQARDNFVASPWQERLTVYHADVKAYQTPHRYDMVICNPPFFQNSLQGDNATRNMARHTNSLSYEDLLWSFDRVLADEGYASILLPVTEFSMWEELLASKEWYIAKKLMIKPRAELRHNRVVGVCKRGNATNDLTEELCIYTTDGYTEHFTELLAPFYLKL